LRCHGAVLRQSEFKIQNSKFNNRQSSIVNRQSEAGMEKSESANFGNSGLKLALMGQATEQS
jgi:hypothetical protein